MNNFVRTTANGIEFNYWKIEEDDDNNKLLFKNSQTGNDPYSTIVEITSTGITGDNINNVSYDSGSSTIIDYTTLDPSTIKINTNTATSQDVKGIIEKYTLTGATGCYVGQPLMIDYNDTDGNIRAKAIDSINSINKIIGISLNQCNVSETVSILRNGYCTARFNYDFTSNDYTTTVKLDSNTTYSTIVMAGNNILFTDSGGTGSDPINNYSSNENYVIVFDAGFGSKIGWTINSLSFEHGSSSLWDRLKYEFSNDNSNYDDSPLQAGFHVSSKNDTTGNVFPDGTTFIETNGGTLNYVSDYRYVKFTFYSDTSVTEPGWSILLRPIIINPNYLSINTPLYLDNTDKTKVTNNSESNLLIGYSAYTDITNDSIFMKVNTI